MSSTVAPRPVSVRAAGAVLWRASESGTELALVHRPRYDDWSFPKGKLDRGETMPFAAVREVAEETGWRCRLGPVLGDVHYEVPEGPKLVRYWSAQAVDGADGPGFSANDETDELRWVAPDKAGGLLSYRRDVDVLGRFVRRGVATSTLVLVRHARAGSRSQWDGDDGLRPLSGSGREQALQVSTLLGLFGPDRVLSAPPVRCRETVAPLAATLGVPVSGEPLLGEEGYWDDPDAGLARARELAAAPGVTVVCSQGGVIPDVVAALAAASPHRLGVDPDDVPARKASTWVLTFDGPDLRGADHYARPTG
ncbi:MULTISPECIES: NUDIX hydrolase [unclassified Pseudonocardia]|uniref:NUDIX hydrolase n=1 Tax=unclassified Pseudonocardia TaxID=2619320 RepID=UPI0025EC2AA7|nr:MULTISPECIES: NUDIX hydrolase [unclassified Pseudonocardia]